MVTTMNPNCVLRRESIVAPQALHLLNGDTVNQKIAQGGLVANRLKEGKPPEEIVEELER